MGKKKQRRRNKWKDLWWLIPSGSVLLISLCAIFIMEFIVLCEENQHAEDPEVKTIVVPALEPDLEAASHAYPSETTASVYEVSLPLVTLPSEIGLEQKNIEDIAVLITETAIAEVSAGTQAQFYLEEGDVYQQILLKNQINSQIAASVDNSAWIENGVAHIFGDNRFSQCKTDNWPKVTMVRLGNEHAIGLTEEGKLVYAGSNAHRQQDINLDGAVARSIDASAFASYAVMTDGTVRISGTSIVSQIDLKDEDNVAAIAAEDTHVVLLRSDGTVCAFGNNDDGACDVDNWRDIVMVDCGYGFTIGLDFYGRVHMCGRFSYGQDALNGLENIVAIAAGSNTCFALDAKGVVYAAGSNSKGQVNVESWTDVTAIAGGYRHTVARRKSGEHLGIGDNGSGQLNSSF